MSQVCALRHQHFCLHLPRCSVDKYFVCKSHESVCASISHPPPDCTKNLLPTGRASLKWFSHVLASKAGAGSGTALASEASDECAAVLVRPSWSNKISSLPKSAAGLLNMKRCSTQRQKDVLSTFVTRVGRLIVENIYMYNNSLGL